MHPFLNKTAGKRIAGMKVAAEITVCRSDQMQQMTHFLGFLWCLACRVTHTPTPDAKNV